MVGSPRWQLGGRHLRTVSAVQRAKHGLEQTNVPPGRLFLHPSQQKQDVSSSRENKREDGMHVPHHFDQVSKGERINGTCSLFAKVIASVLIARGVSLLTLSPPMADKHQSQVWV